MADRVWHALEARAVLDELGVDPARGLDPAEAGARLARHGPNELRREEKASPWSLFFAQFKNILIVILLVATMLSAAVGELIDAGIIFLIIVFCAVLGFVQEFRAGRALEALQGMLAPATTVRRGGAELEVPARELVPGDVLVLEAGDRMPADARLLEVRSLQCDEAPLTGESLPVAKDAAPVAAAATPGDRRCMVLAGTTTTYGRGLAVVTQTGMHTEFGRIAAEVSAAPAQKTPLERRTEELGKWLGLATLAICVLVVGVSLARELAAGTFSLPSVLPMVMFAIALAVAAVPEALAAIVTGALAIAMHEMAKRNALVRRMPAVETLGCTSVICSDKTGTLTKGEMTVRRVYLGGRSLEVSGAGYAPEGAISGPPDDPALQRLLEACVLVNDAALAQEDGRWRVRGDPTEGALIALAAKGGVRAEAARATSLREAEFPFSSERKRMSTVHRMADGRRMVFVKGAPEVVLERCALDAQARAAALAANEAMAGAALRVLALACKGLPPGAVDEATAENGLEFLGLAGMMDPPREEAVEAIGVCRQVHVRPVMITGDHPLTAMAVAREIGIHRQGDLALTGEDLARLDDAALDTVVERVTVYARVSPLDKLKIVKSWQRRGHVVAMTGDGVNDAPALKHADIGVAMGISGTDVAKEAADIVLADDNFASIVAAIERGRWIYDNIKKYLTYLLRANMTEVVVLGGVVIALGPAYLPLLPAAILYINLASDGLPALALGVAPPDPDIMRRPPRDARESIFSFDVRALILFAVVIECPLFLWVFFAHIGDLEAARTKIFLMFVVIELALALNFRSLRYSIFAAPPHKWLLLAIFWEAVLLVVLLQIPAVREAFGIAMPRPGDVALVLAFALGIAATVELAKAYLRRRGGSVATVEATG